MENKINIAELLKDCPKGMELDCTVFDNIVFDSVSNLAYPIKVVTKDGSKSLTLTKYGCTTSENKNAKCIIFPKGKTTWEGFVPPIEFKDGDIIYIRATFDWVCIYKEDKDTENIYKYVAICISSESTNIVYDKVSLCCKKGIIKMRIATKKEKRKLFHAIKVNGYKWNPETKILEKLPKFKVGDRIRHKDSGVYCTLGEYSEGISAYHTNIGLSITPKDLEQWELFSAPDKFDVTTLKPFNKVLVRTDNNHRWKIQFFERLNNVLKDSFVCMGGYRYHQCIPYKGNEHLLDTANDCDDYFRTWK